MVNKTKESKAEVLLEGLPLGKQILIAVLQYSKENLCGE